jgi:hypothetical protein
MDPVMQTLFGKMPIEQLSGVQVTTANRNNSNAILLLAGITIVLGFTAYYYYKQNEELKLRLKHN